ncbi:MAG: hypothetical protein U9O78_02900 [Patescibacteria group bacterium]|nr:hypothetical protein [Patescibacteria group bacterium]
MLNPWVFGDEYIYLSKARNISYGIDVMSDASIGHKYPPLYSYLLSLVFTDNAHITYRNVQFLNLGISQLLIALIFYLLNKVFIWHRSKQGRIFLIFSWLFVASLSIFSGNYFVAMSENLYTPLVLLIFTLVILIDQKRVEKKWPITIAFGILTALAILTRSIGLSLIPSLVLTLIFIAFNSAKKSTKQKIIKSALYLCLTLLFTVGPYFLFKKTELVLSTNPIQSLEQKGYSPNPYLSVFAELFSGNFLWFNAFKVIGNHLIYIFISSFFFPFLFYLDEIIISIKTKKVKTSTVFMTLFAIFSGGLSFLHCYLGFKNNPIKYSTYFRYIDPTILVFIVYGLLQLWQRLKNKKQKIQQLSWLLFIALSIVFLIALPNRDFYITINSLGWAWLDLFKSNQWLIKPIIILLVALFTIFWKFNKKLLVFWAGGLILINLLTINVSLQMHHWMSGIYQDSLDEPLKQIVQDQGIRDFYVKKETLKKIDHSYLYYLKYYLLFETDKMIPVTIIDNLDNTNLSKNFALIETFNASTKYSLDIDVMQKIDIADQFTIIVSQ